MLSGRRNITRVLALAVPVAFVGAGVAAAATGSLGGSDTPPANSHTSAPNPHAHDAATTDSSANSGATGPDASPTSPATFGLCTAFTAGGLSTHGVAYRNLAAAAGGAGSIASYCAPILASHHHSSGSSTSGGAGVNHGNSNPHGSEPANGKPSTVPPPHS